MAYGFETHRVIAFRAGPAPLPWLYRTIPAYDEGRATPRQSPCVPYRRQRTGSAAARFRLRGAALRRNFEAPSTASVRLNATNPQRLFPFSTIVHRQ